MDTGQQYSAVPQATHEVEHHQQTPWWGSQTAQNSWASLHKDHDLPEAVPAEFQNARSLPQAVPMETDGYSNFPQKSERYEDVQPMQQPGPLPWWKLVGLVAGLLGGLLTRHKKSNDTPSPSATSGSPTSTVTPGPFGTPTTFPASVTSHPSSCRGTVCPSMLASARLETDDGAFFIFARGSDDALWYRQATSNGWEASWQHLNGSLKSQPAAVCSRTGTVNVLATWEDGSVRMRTYQDGGWDADWTSLGGDSVNPPTVCSRGNGNLEIFATNGSNLLMHRSYDGHTWSPSLSDDWEIWGGYTSATAAAACGSADRIDVVSYGGYSNMLHDVGWMHYTNGSWETWGGNSRPPGDLGYRGDPALVAVDDNTTSFFGIGTDKEMYHVEWSPSTNYSQVESLGGSFESAPHAFASTSSDGRIDVLAVSTNDTLLHRARVGGSWSTDWEDLGGYLNSAPLAVNTEGNCIAVFGLGPWGRMIHGNFTMTDKVSWGQGTWWDDGPDDDLSSDWYRAGPAR
ncbi:hypothetical protein NKR23_g4167 [Pleurostoma richardsiae]|uniref:PLL-like beta propeller domain-containing protein n=1 Tax=Pleurostoma richardsiae TaxID=41990 RepID=A0AA38RWK0_9PEZI|nr:hypothetical protein NKR23_g4167 [Pleurostoma richardsiae]